MFFAGIIYVKNKKLDLDIQSKVTKNYSKINIQFNIIHNNNVLYTLLKEIIGILNIFV